MVFPVPGIGGGPGPVLHRRPVRPLPDPGLCRGGGRAAAAASRWRRAGGGSRGLARARGGGRRADPPRRTDGCLYFRHLTTAIAVVVHCF